MFREEAIRILKPVVVVVGLTSLPLMMKLWERMGLFIKETPEATAGICIRQLLPRIGVWEFTSKFAILSTPSLIENAVAMVAAPHCSAVAVIAPVTVINL